MLRVMSVSHRGRVSSVSSQRDTAEEMAVDNAEQEQSVDKFVGKTFASPRAALAQIAEQVMSARAHRQVGRSPVSPPVAPMWTALQDNPALLKGAVRR